MTKSQLALMARKFLWVFPKLASGHQCPPHLKFVAEKLTKAIESPTKKKKLLIIKGPPRHGKSEQFPVHGPPWILGNWPKLRIIIAAYASSLAEKHSARGRDLFEKWGPLLWGVKPSASLFNKAKWDTEEGGGVLAIGTEGGATGFGADVFFIDDYHKDRKDAESSLQRDNVWSWWQSVVATRLHPGAVVVIFATQWHEDDLIGRLEQQAKDEGDEFPFDFEVVRLPAIAEEDDAMGRKPGEALWPWWNDEKQLDDARKTVGPYEWESLFQGNPTAKSGHLFKSESFRDYTRCKSTGAYLCWRAGHDEPIKIPKNEPGLTKTVYCDPSLETKKVNDPTGAGAWLYSQKHRIWLLLDRLNERIDHTLVQDRLLQFAFKNHCTTIGVENEKIGKILKKQSAGRDKIGGKSIPFREISTGGLDKYARAVPMATYFENERVFLPRGALWRSEYESQLIKFPNAKHDEDVDITSMADEMESKLSVAEILARRNR